MTKSILKIITVLAVMGLSLPFAHGLTVLQYHHVSDATPAATSISPALFSQHMEHLDAEGFEVMALPDVVARLRAGRAMPDKAVVITFDDGYRSVYDVAFPILKGKAWPFTVFINAKPLDEGRKQFVSWDHLREMAGAGASVANHTFSHPHLVRLNPGETESEWRARIEQELTRTERRIKEELGQNHKLLAYPYGEYNRALQRLVGRMGYIAFAQHSGPIGPDANHLALPRFPFGGAYGALEDFAIKAASLPMPLKSVQVFDDQGRKQLEETVLPKSVSRPQLHLELEDPAIAKRLQCFASGQGASQVKVEASFVIAQAKKPLPVGRSHYNCTAATGKAGRFYWYSEFFIRKQENGEWYKED